MKKNIRPANSKGKWHGYQEWYYVDDTIMHRCNYKNGLRIGYEEWHMDKKTDYHIR